MSVDHDDHAGIIIARQRKAAYSEVRVGVICTGEKPVYRVVFRQQNMQRPYGASQDGPVRGGRNRLRLSSYFQDRLEKVCSRHRFHQMLRDAVSTTGEKPRHVGKRFAESPIAL